MTVSNTVVADFGYTAINGGGTAIGTTLEDYATQGVEAGTAIGTLVAADALEFVYDGGVTSGATIFKGGADNVLGSGTAVGMTVNGGDCANGTLAAAQRLVATSSMAAC